MAESESSAGGFVFDDEKPNQPQQFDFPKREFGKAKPVKRAFQAQWFKKWRCSITIVPRTLFSVIPVY